VCECHRSAQVVNFDQSIQLHSTVPIVQMGRNWFTHELLAAWWQTWYSPGSNYRGYWSNLVTGWSGTTSPHMTSAFLTSLRRGGYQPFMKACIMFILLQRLRYTDYIGGRCNGGCKRLVMDGVQVNFQVKNTHLISPWLDETDHRGSVEDDVVHFIPRKAPGRVKLQQLLRRLCEPRRKYNVLRSSFVDHSHNAVSHAEFTHVVAQLHLYKDSVSEYGALYKLLTVTRDVNDRLLLIQFEDGGRITYQVNATVALLVHVIVSPYPLTSSLPSVEVCEALLHILQQLSDANDIPATFRTVNAPTIQFVMDHSPVLGRFIMEVTDHFTIKLHADTGVSAIFDLMISKVKSFFNNVVPRPFKTFNNVNPGFFDCGMYYPSNPVSKYLPHYAEPRQTVDGLCNKHSLTGTGKTPGLFKVFCFDCNRLTGFHAMTTSESPRTVFDLLLTRWEEQPDLVVYDNACNVHRFALKREPYLFRDVSFVVDATHWSGHVMCSGSYNSSVQRSKCKDVNTQKVEQDNAKDLKPYRTQMRFFSQNMHLWHLRFHSYCKEKMKQTGHLW